MAPGSAAGRVKLFVLGDARIVARRETLAPSAEVVFAAALYLLLEREKEVPRRKLEALLWPDVSPAAASHRLRQTLLRLRQVGIPVARGRNSSLSVRGAPVEVDLDLFVAGGWPEGTTGKRSFAILAGYEPRLSNEFQDWLDAHRRDMGGAVSRVLLPVIADHRKSGDWAAVEAAATALLEVSPYNEEATLALAESCAMRGAKYDACRILERYANETGASADELRVQPSIMRRRIVERMSIADPERHQTPVFGREPVLKELFTMLATSRNGRGRATIITGQAGIGKSRVLSELTDYAALQGFTPQRIQCRASHKLQPLSAFVGLVPSLRGLPGAIGCSPDTLAYLDTLTRHNPPSVGEAPSYPDAHWTYSQVQRALFDILDAVAHESPILVAIEDAHWLDSTSCDVLRDMIPWISTKRIMFAITGRHPPESWRGDMPPSLAAIELAPLDEAAAAELVDNLSNLDGRLVQPEHRDWCVQVGEGNPYFLQELATHYIDTGHGYQVPPSLTALLATRVDRLDVDSLQLFQTCALLENNASIARMELVLGYAPHRFLKCINSLGALGMVSVEQPRPELGLPSRISSKHELLSNVAIQRLSSPARAFLHRRIGTILEGESDMHRSTSILWDAAKHWQLAGDAERALSLVLSCAQHLMKVGLSREAAAAYERCLTFCTTDAQRLEVLEGSALANYRASDWQRVREKTALARSYKDQLHPEADRHDDLELMELRARWQTLDWSDVVLAALACLGAEQASLRHRIEAGIMALMLLENHDGSSDVVQAHATIRKLLRDPMVPNVLRLQADMVYHTKFGTIDSAVVAARELVHDQTARTNQADVFRSYCNAAIVFRVAGLFEDAKFSLIAALKLAEDNGLEQSVLRVLPLLANLTLEFDDTACARDCWSRLNELSVHPTNRFAQLEIDSIGARLALLEGDVTEARRRWQHDLASILSDQVHHRRAYNLALHVAIDLLDRGYAKTEVLEHLIDAFSRSREVIHQGYSMCVIRAALRCSGDEERAASIFEDYAATYRREPWPVPPALLDSVRVLNS